MPDAINIEAERFADILTSFANMDPDELCPRWFRIPIPFPKPWPLQPPWPEFFSGLDWAIHLQQMYVNPISAHPLAQSFALSGAFIGQLGEIKRAARYMPENLDQEVFHRYSNSIDEFGGWCGSVPKSEILRRFFEKHGFPHPKPEPPPGPYWGDVMGRDELFVVGVNFVSASSRFDDMFGKQMGDIGLKLMQV